MSSTPFEEILMSLETAIDGLCVHRIAVEKSTVLNRTVYSLTLHLDFDYYRVQLDTSVKYPGQERTASLVMFTKFGTEKSHLFLKSKDSHIHSPDFLSGQIKNALRSMEHEYKYKGHSFQTKLSTRTRDILKEINTLDNEVKNFSFTFHRNIGDGRDKLVSTVHFLAGNNFYADVMEVKAEFKSNFIIERIHVNTIKGYKVFEIAGENSLTLLLREINKTVTELSKGTRVRKKPTYN